MSLGCLAVVAFLPSKEDGEDRSYLFPLSKVEEAVAAVREALPGALKPFPSASHNRFHRSALGAGERSRHTPRQLRC